MPLIILAVGIFLYMKRRNQAGANQPPPPPPPQQDVSEYYKVQPVSPILSPTSANLPYNGSYYVSPPCPSPLCGVLSIRRLVSLEPWGSDDVPTSDGRRTKFDDLYEPPFSHPWVSRSWPILWYSRGVILSNVTGNPNGDPRLTTNLAFFRIGHRRSIHDSSQSI